jgi:hypothetical protein
MDYRHTAARADRVSALMARVLLIAAVLLAATGQAALILHVALPAWAWAFILPDTLAVAVYAFLRSLTPRPDHRIYGG